MKPHEPWLADSIIASVEEWIRNGRNSTQFRFTRNSHAVTAYRTTPYVKIARICKLPPSGEIEPRGKVSDSEHCIDAIFPKTFATEIERSGVQSPRLGDPGAFIRVIDPGIICTDHCLPPKPWLRIETWEIATVASTLGKDFTLGLPASHDERINRSMMEFARVGGPDHRISSPETSPTSVKSQACYSPDRHDGAVNFEQEISQQQFHTQVAASLQKQREPSRKPHPHTRIGLKTTTGHNQLLQALQNKGPTRKVAKEAKEKLLPSPMSGDLQLPATTQNDGPAVQTPKDQLQSTISSLPHPSGRLATQAEDPKSSQIEVSEFKASASSPTNRQEIPNKNYLRRSPTSGQQTPLVSPQLPNLMIQRFRRWRREAQAGRYVPRYVQKIPRDQAVLLELDESWQPALVGQTREGQVPLSLLEQFVKAADSRMETVALIDRGSASNINLGEAPTNDDHPEEKTMAENVEGHFSSESDDSVDSKEWPSSPPTQERRNRLPSNSPPPDLQQRQQPREIDTIEEENEPPSSDKSNQIFSSVENTVEVGHTVSDARALKSLITPENPSSDQRENGCAISAVMPAQYSPKLRLEPEEDNRLIEHRFPSTVTGPRCDLVQPQLVQVERTPFAGRHLNPPNELPAMNWVRHSKGTIGDGDPMSSFVPGTHPELSPNAVTGEPSAKDFAARMEVRTSHPTNSVPTKFVRPIARPDSHLRKVNAVSSEDQGSLETPRLLQHGTMDTTSYAKKRHCLQEFKKAVDGGPASKAPVVPQSSMPQPNKSALQDPENVPPKWSPPGSFARSSHEISERYPEPMATAPEPATILFESDKRHGAKRANSEGFSAPSKKRRKALGPAGIDLDYASPMEKVREHRRNILQPLSKPKFSTRHSTSSSIEDVDSSGDMPTISTKRNRTPGSAAISRQRPSTPITRVSTYSATGNSESICPSTSSVTQISAMMDPEHHDLFAKFQVTYPDYRGGITQFMKSCLLIKELLSQAPGSFHQFLLDDAIFHHHHSYRQYLIDEAPEVPFPMSFDEFYRERVEKPSHLELIVSIAALEELPCRKQCKASNLNDKQEARLSDAEESMSITTADVTTMKDKIALSQEPSPKDNELEGELSHKSIDVIEEWRKSTAGISSPELGTPNIERSLPDVPQLQLSASHEDTPVLRAKSSHHVPDSRHTTSSSRPKSANLTSELTTSKSTPMPQTGRPQRPSASPFVRPPLPLPPPPPSLPRAVAPEEDSPPYLSDTEPPQKWWQESKTPFRIFAQHYSSLPGERASGLAPLGRNGVGIDFSSWRT